MDLASQDSGMEDDPYEEGLEPKAGMSTTRKHRKKEDSGEKTTKTRRLKGHGITSGTFQIPHIQRNADGTPVLPLALGVMVFRSFGVVTQRAHFSTERYIFPIGFECTRRYPSMIDRTDTVEYVCRIADGGAAPRFEIDPADQPGVVISAGTPTGAWTQVVKAANLIRQRNHSNSVSGPDYYGLAHNVVKALIQELPGARDVPGYIWQNFVEEPSAEEARAGKKALAGASKTNRVVGKRRKSLGVPKAEDDEDDAATLANGSPAYQSYNDNGYSRSSSAMQGSMSPPGHYPYQPDSTSASISNLIHSSNPYDLPPPLLDDSSRSPPMDSYPSLPGFDPYAIPPPQAMSSNPYQSPTLGGSPGNAEWGPASPWFDQA
ncbi:hypothetical protein P7C70_g5534, partial [Phenoliferia sp. Uapishka_3]